MHSKKLIAQYENDYFLKTGSKIKIYPLEAWEDKCRLPEKTTIDELVDTICLHADWTLSMVKTKCRSEEARFPRQIVSFILYHNGFSKRKIARFFDEHHVTVILRLRAVSDLLENGRSTRDFLDTLMDSIKTSELCLGN